MKTLVPAALLAASLSACAASIPETTRYDGQTFTTQIKADSKVWRLLINGQTVATTPIMKLSAENTMRGSYQGKPVLVNMYYRGNGWTSRYVGDVFVGGELVETLVIN